MQRQRMLAEAPQGAEYYSGLVSCWDVVIDRVCSLVQAGLHHEQGGLHLLDWQTRRGIFQKDALEAVDACSNVQDMGGLILEWSGGLR